jgi:hypothetical protein
MDIRTRPDSVGPPLLKEYRVGPYTTVEALFRTQYKTSDVRMKNKIATRSEEYK